MCTNTHVSNTLQHMDKAECQSVVSLTTAYNVKHIIIKYKTQINRLRNRHDK